MSAITIAEAANPENVAEGTRDILKGLLQGLPDDGEDEQALKDWSAPEYKTYKRDFKDALEASCEGLAPDTLVLHVSRVAFWNISNHVEAEEGVYVRTLMLEAASEIIRKAAHTSSGWDLSDRIAEHLCAPFGTGWGEEEESMRVLRQIPDTAIQALEYALPTNDHASPRIWLRLPAVHVPPEVLALALPPQPMRYWERPLLLGYSVKGEPWLAGFRTYEDLTQGKFVRMSIGSYLKRYEKDMSDEEIKTAVETAKRRYAKCAWTVYPNDVCFADVYVNLCDHSSCMSYSAGTYDSSLHPMTVYSTRYHGGVDNGLALFVSADRQSRAIVNTETMSFVRFYGLNEHERALEAIGIAEDDACLEGVLLYCFEQNGGSSVIAPYIDGGYTCIEKTEDGKYLRIGHYGAGADYASGVLHLAETHECAYSGEDALEYDMTWCDGGEYWVCDWDWRHVKRDFITDLDWLETDLHEVEVDGCTRYVRDIDSLLDADYWPDSNGDYWNESVEPVITADGEIYREDDCEWNEEKEEWKLI